MSYARRVIVGFRNNCRAPSRANSVLVCLLYDCPTPTNDVDKQHHER